MLGMMNMGSSVPLLQGVILRGIVISVVVLLTSRYHANAFQYSFRSGTPTTITTARSTRKTWPHKGAVAAAAINSCPPLVLNARINGKDESTVVLLVEPPTVINGTILKGVEITQKTDDDLSNDLLSYDNIFDIVAGRAATCLVESDLRRDAKEGYSKVISSSATNWINDATAFQLKKAFDRVKLKVKTKFTGQ
jgi:hypothetical protein